MSVDYPLGSSSKFIAIFVTLRRNKALSRYVTEIFLSD
jgi:hypothetical protein